MKTLINLVRVIAFLFPVYCIADGIPTSADSSLAISVVKIETFKYHPTVIKIAPGTTVQWFNVDSVAHDVTSGESITGRKSRGLQKTKFPDGIFSSGLFGKNQTFSKTFDELGEYPYYCNIHPFMTGKIVVK